MSWDLRQRLDHLFEPCELRYHASHRTKLDEKQGVLLAESLRVLTLSRNALHAGNQHDSMQCTSSVWQGKALQVKPGARGAVVL